MDSLKLLLNAKFFFTVIELATIDRFDIYKLLVLFTFMLQSESWLFHLIWKRDIYMVLFTSNWINLISRGRWCLLITSKYNCSVV